MMTKRAKWGVTAAILLMIAGMIAYPQLKNKFKASQDAASVVPTSGTSLRNQTLNINAEVLKYQSLTDKIMSTGSTLPDEEVDLAFESSGGYRASQSEYRPDRASGSFRRDHRTSLRE